MQIECISLLEQNKKKCSISLFLCYNITILIVGILKERETVKERRTILLAIDFLFLTSKMFSQDGFELAAAFPQ